MGHLVTVLESSLIQALKHTNHCSNLIFASSLLEERHDSGRNSSGKHGMGGGRHSHLLLLLLLVLLLLLLLPKSPSTSTNDCLSPRRFRRWLWRVKQCGAATVWLSQCGLPGHPPGECSVWPASPCLPPLHLLGPPPLPPPQTVRHKKEKQDMILSSECLHVAKCEAGTRKAQEWQNTDLTQLQDPPRRNVSCEDKHSTKKTWSKVTHEVRWWAGNGMEY